MFLYSNSRIFVIPVYIFNGRKQTQVDTSGYCQRCCACVVCMTSTSSWPNCVSRVARIGSRLFFVLFFLGGGCLVPTHKCRLHLHQKTRIFLAFGFFVESCQATSPKHSKKPESKNPPPQRDFLKLRRNFTGFCQCKRSLQSRRYYSGFWSRGT